MTDRDNAALIERDHPEGTCDDCGGPNICWWAESELFNSVADRAAILCPLCFAGRLQARSDLRGCLQLESQVEALTKERDEALEAYRLKRTEAEYANAYADEQWQDEQRWIAHKTLEAQVEALTEDRTYWQGLSSASATRNDSLRETVKALRERLAFIAGLDKADWHLAPDIARRAINQGRNDG